jgi:hypothetical protein
MQMYVTILSFKTKFRRKYLYLFIIFLVIVPSTKTGVYFYCLLKTDTFMSLTKNTKSEFQI